jgi:hypothetical protein
MKRSLLACLMILFVSLACFSAKAESVDDIAKLARSGIGEEVLLALVERAETGYALSANDILTLKKANVSDKVLAAMLTKQRAPTLANAVPTPSPQAIAPDEFRPVTTEPAVISQTPGAAHSPPPQTANVATPPTTATRADERDLTVLLQNSDAIAWDFRLDRRKNYLWLLPSERGDKADGRVAAFQTAGLAVPPGKYKVKLLDGDDQRFDVEWYGKTLIVLTRKEGRRDKLIATVFENGKRRGAEDLGHIRKLEAVRTPVVSVGSAREPRPAAPQTTVIYEEPKTTVVYRAAPPTVIYRTPTPVYVVRDWTYYSPPFRPAYPYYGPVYCPPPRSFFSFSYGQINRRSGWSAGAGARR